MVEFFFPHSKLGQALLSFSTSMAVTANLHQFIFILKVMELQRCLDVFELAGELFYFIHSSIQKLFYFAFTILFDHTSKSV